jgi:hypothetical protein
MNDEFSDVNSQRAIKLSLPTTTNIPVPQLEISYKSTLLNIKLLLIKAMEVHFLKSVELLEYSILVPPTANASPLFRSIIMPFKEDEERELLEGHEKPLSYEI